MPMFYCDQFMVDTDCLVAAGKFDGIAAMDGTFLLALVLAIGQKGELINFGAAFKDELEREAVFRALAVHKQAHDRLWDTFPPDGESKC
jgi:hypothetical protein